MAAKPDLQRAYEALKNKQKIYTRLFDYYDGNQPMVYANARLRQVFGNNQTRFTQNWCAVVIDSEIERIELREIAVSKNSTATKRLAELFESTELSLDADDIHKASLVCGEAFLFAWKDEDGAIEAYYNDPRLCHAFYKADKPREMSFAAKWWIGDDERRYLNLYYPDQIEYYVSTQEAKSVSTWQSFQLDPDNPPAANPHQQIPIFHFRVERRTIKSRLTDVLEPQDAINKLFADMMVAAEFAAFKQRWVISNADIGELKNSPNNIWDLPAGDGEGQQTQVGELSASELKNFLDPMDKLAGTIAIITRTPKHYIFAQNGDPSGEALIAMEAPLNKKATADIKRLSVTWRQAAAFLLKLDGQEDVAANTIMPVFARPETVQPMTTAQIRQTNVTSGIPLRVSLREEGWTEAQIKALDAEPPDRMKLIEMANAVKDKVDDATYLNIVAPAFGWDKAMVNTIAAGLALEREARARAEARGFVEQLLGGSGETTNEPLTEPQPVGVGGGANAA